MGVEDRGVIIQRFAAALLHALRSHELVMRLAADELDLVGPKLVSVMVARDRGHDKVTDAARAMAAKLIEMNLLTFAKPMKPTNDYQLVVTNRACGVAVQMTIEPDRYRFDAIVGQAQPESPSPATEVTVTDLVTWEALIGERP